MGETPAALGAGDFDAWVEARFAELLRFAYLVTGSQHAAEDALQTALTRALGRWDEVARTREPGQYVKRMVVNAHIDSWRRWGRRERPFAEPRRDPADEPTAAGSAVWEVCAALPVRQRAVVVLRFYEDLDYAEIAELLDIAEATARSHVHRALAALRVALTEEDRDG